MWTVGILLFLASWVLSLVLTPAVKSLATRLNFVDRPDARKTHERPVPYGGGVAIFLATTLPAVAAGMLALWCRAHGRPAWLDETIYSSVFVHLGGIAKKLPQFWAVLAGGLAIFLLGLIDDRKRLGPFVKLVVQTLVATGVVAAGVHARLFVSQPFLGDVVTVVWIVGLTNAFNFLDNMDGLSAGVALIVASAFLVVALASAQAQLFVAAALIPFIGALAGFLPFNYAPARLFMGDAGALFLGYYLSVLSVLFTFYRGPETGFRPFLLPLIIFAVPIYDAVTVTILRLGERHSPFVGDRQHLSHRLVAIGLSGRLAVGAVHLLTLGIVLSAVLLYYVQGTFAEVTTIVQTLVLLALVAVIERAIRS